MQKDQKQSEHDSEFYSEIKSSFESLKLQAMFFPYIVMSIYIESSKAKQLMKDVEEFIEWKTRK